MSNCLLIILVIASFVTFGGFPNRFSKCCFHSFTLSCWLAVFNFALAVLFLQLTSFIVCQAILDCLSSTESLILSLSALARNQTKDSWTWNLAESGSCKGTRMRVGWKRSWEQLATGQQRVGVEPRRDAVDSGDSSREDRVQRRRWTLVVYWLQYMNWIYE